MPKNFILLWTSQILSQVTIQIMNFLLLARIYQTTQSAIATSLLWVSYALPTIFFGPIGAGVVDMVSRRKTLMITNLLQSLIIFLYIFTHNYSVFLLFVVVVIYSFLNQFYVPAEMAALPSVVSQKHLPKANSLFFLTQQLSLIFGFGLAGLIEKLLTFKGTLIFCSILLFIAFLSVFFLPKLKPRNKTPQNIENLIKKLFDNILEGYRYIKGNRTILFPLGLLFIIQVSLSIVTANLPSIAQEIFHVSISYAGVLVVVPAGIGAAIGSYLVHKLISKKWRKKKIIDISLFILALSTILLLFGSLIFGPIAIIFIGLGFVGINIPTLTFLQENTPDSLRGRVFGNLWFFITVASIFPLIFSGAITEFLGVKTLLTMMSVGVILILAYSRTHGQKLVEEVL